MQTLSRELFRAECRRTDTGETAFRRNYVNRVTDRVTDPDNTAAQAGATGHATRGQCR